ncbi:tetratricopeptide repeat protein [Polyangium fumosum]|uniref:Tetratricopeptide repeat protein n=1 Tax=Polyangium fumosum TaxID=889272 RepID=A0A4U1JF86_9BACT|nr:tetratricopeptide repeat protein [Polyangium fumosum]TKD09899.1 tetratricopeptide repeat protein [Polyangium fumosum]
MRAVASPLLPLFVLLSACGGGPSAQQEPAKAPVVEVGAGHEAPPVSAQGPEEDGDAESRATNDVEALDTCIEHMREGRGLPERVKASPEASQYAQTLAAERAGNLDQAKEGYLKIVQQYPDSPYIPLVYFAFGELFFKDGQKDPIKLDFAEQSYDEVLKFPMPNNTAWIAANLRLAEVYRQNGDPPKALSSLKKVAEAAAKEPGASCAASLVPPARARLVAVYADVGRPSAAFDFFKTASGSNKGDERTTALAMVASLAELYVQQQKHDDAATALISAHARFYDTAYCQREGQLVTKLGPSLTATRRDQLASAHSVHCIAQ